MRSHYQPSLEQVKELAPNGNLIPIYRELPADLETPVSVYLKLQGKIGGPSFLLESVEKGEQVGRYSFLGVDPPMTMAAWSDQVTIGGAGGTVLEKQQGVPFSILQELLASRQPVAIPELPVFTGGAVGYFGYDMVRFVERLPATANDDLKVPDLVMLFSDNLVVFDHVRHRLLVIANMRVEKDLRAAYADAIARIEKIVSTIHAPLVPPVARECANEADWISNFTQEEHEENVRIAKEYIAAGDIFQVVLSQRLSRETEAEPFTIYRALRMLNPSPYMYFLDFQGVAAVTGGDQQEPIHIIGSSPEMHVRSEDSEAFLHPIAGTRWRGSTPKEDEKLAQDLLADPKERAEHVMLVDLGRNDLGRVCQYGTVSVPEMMVIEKYSHVMHIVSDVRGTLQPGHDAFSLMRATLPAGTLSGAPKVRAMEIIEELEGTRRGPYGGAVGYIGYDGNMDTCITIRTILMRGKTCTLQAGGGIVADSEPTYEYEESLNKAKALSVAVERAEAGL